MTQVALDCCHAKKEEEEKKWGYNKELESWKECDSKLALQAFKNANIVPGNIEIGGMSFNNTVTR